MPPLKNSKQELFTLNWFKGETKEQSAIIAGYAPKWARSTGSLLSTNPNILARYKELQQKAEDALIADVKERKQILTEIARGKLTDYISCGPDGDQISVGSESPNSRACQEITSHTEFDKETETGAVITKLKLHNPVQAIAELNKMDGAYAPEKSEHFSVVLTGELTDDQLAHIARNGHNGSRSSKRITEEASSP